MADLTEIQSAQAVKIAGSDNSGTESNYMNVDSYGNAKIGIHVNGTQIGNVGDRLKVDAQLSSGSITITTLAAACNIIKQAESAITVKVETDLTGSTYTVPSGKTFNLVSFCGSYDAAQPMYLRLKKQTGGVGAFVTILRFSLSVNGQDASNYNVTVPNGISLGTTGDVFKITYEPAVGRGNLWAGFFGVEY
jgi:hypothetical protein